LSLILPSPGRTVGETFGIEMFFTFMLVSFILHSVFSKLSIQSDTVLAVSSVCVSLYFNIRCSAAITGACLNPAVGLANYSVYAMVNPANFTYFPSYFFGPLIGGVIAGFVCKYLVMPNVPNFYDDLLNQIRDVQNEIINIKRENSLPTNYLPPTKGTE
jgi:glycerol uptake facilitator-like aquaporin